MKKILILSAIAFSSFIFSNSSNAETYAPAIEKAGKEFVMADTTGATGASLKVATSPGVWLRAGTSSGSYALTSMNVNTSKDKQLQYGIHNTYSGYYQAPSTTEDAWVTEVAGVKTTTDIADPFATDTKWTAMGGSGS